MPTTYCLQDHNKVNASETAAAVAAVVTTQIYFHFTNNNNNNNNNNYDDDDHKKKHVCKLCSIKSFGSFHCKSKRGE